AELAPVPPGGALVGGGVQEDRVGRGQSRQRVVAEPYRVDQCGAAAVADRMRARDGTADAGVADAPVPNALGDFLDCAGDLPGLGHAWNSMAWRRPGLALPSLAQRVEPAAVPLRR